MTQEEIDKGIMEFIPKKDLKETAERIAEEGRKAIREAMDKLNEIEWFAESAAEKMECLSRSVEKANKIGAKYGF